MSEGGWFGAKKQIDARSENKDDSITESRENHGYKRHGQDKRKFDDHKKGPKQYGEFGNRPQRFASDIQSVPKLDRPGGLRQNGRQETPMPGKHWKDNRDRTPVNTGLKVEMPNGKKFEFGFKKATMEPVNPNPKQQPQPQEEPKLPVITVGGGSGFRIDRANGAKIEIGEKEEKMKELSEKPRHVRERSTFDVHVAGQAKFSMKRLHAMMEAYEQKVYKNNKPPPLERKTPGYLIIMDLVNTMRNPDKAYVRTGGGRHYPSGNVDPSNVKLVVQDADRFVSNRLEKATNLWNSKSDRAFALEVTEILNKVTNASTRNQVRALENLLRRELWTPTPEEIEEERSRGWDQDPMDREGRIDFIVEKMTDKAVKEQGFTKIYADLTRMLRPEIKDKIREKNSNTVQDYIYTPSTDESDSIVSLGTSRFMAFLHNVGIYENTSEVVQKLWEMVGQIEKNMNVYLIEMFSVFVMSSTKESCQKLAAAQFQTDSDEPQTGQAVFDRFIALEEAKLPNRIHFMIKDVHEKLDEYLLGKVIKKVAVTTETKKNYKSMVRNAFSLFEEIDGAPRSPETRECMKGCTISPSDFLFACMEIFPDYSKSHHIFCDFICFGLKMMNMRYRDLEKTMIRALHTYKEGVADDCPPLWTMTADLLYTMIIQKVIDVSSVKSIRKQFPDNAQSWSPGNSMKWFLYDIHDFHTSVRLSEDWLRLGDRKEMTEIRDALTMPDRLDKLTADSPVSKLTVVAFVRSVGCSLGTVTSISQLMKWRPFINKINEKGLGEIFCDEMSYILDEKADFECEDVLLSMNESGDVTV